MNFKDYIENVLNEELKHEGHLKGNKITISELKPNEAENIVNKLRNSGIKASYEYLKGSYYQYVIIDNANSELLTKVNSILSKIKVQ